MLRLIALSVAVLAVTGPAWAVNKCTGPDGKTVFQDAPCAGKGEKIEVRPASGSAPVPAPLPVSAQPPWLQLDLSAHRLAQLIDHRLFQTASAHDQHRHFAHAQQRRRRAPDHQMADTRVPVGAHDQQGGALQLREWG